SRLTLNAKTLISRLLRSLSSPIASDLFLLRSLPTPISSLSSSRLWIFGGIENGEGTPRRTSQTLGERNHPRIQKVTYFFISLVFHFIMLIIFLSSIGDLD
ncbi:unnamed protein product, partial [Arabidopsis halleri]